PYRRAESRAHPLAAGGGGSGVRPGFRDVNPVGAGPRGPAVAVVSGGWLLDAPAAHASLREGLSARWQSAWGSALAGDPCADGASFEQWIGGTSLLGADVWGRRGE